MAVSRSGYYDWLDRPISTRAKINNALSAQILQIHADSSQIYGYRKIYQSLQQLKVNCSEKRILRLMQVNNIFSKTKKKFKATTNSNHSLPIADNILNRNFIVAAPNTHWVGDISYIWTKEGWLYLATVIDLYSRAVVGWAVQDKMTTNLIEDALIKAIWRRKPKPGLVFHSDRGSQYASWSFKNLLQI